MKRLKKFAANNKSDNASAKFRAKRINQFYSLIRNKYKKSSTIVDLGGTNYFWDLFKPLLTGFNLTLINLNKDSISGYNGIIGDITNLKFIKDKTFDIVFSNSVIEHLPSLELQKKLSDEILRIGSSYFIQTPAFIFPLEPHFLFPFFHWMPVSFRIRLIRSFNLGWYTRLRDYEQAKCLADSIRILKKRELKNFFPEAKIITERFIVFPKSYIVTNL